MTESCSVPRCSAVTLGPPIGKKVFPVRRVANKMATWEGGMFVSISYFSSLVYDVTINKKEETIQKPKRKVLVAPFKPSRAVNRKLLFI